MDAFEARSAPPVVSEPPLTQPRWEETVADTAQDGAPEPEERVEAERTKNKRKSLKACASQSSVASRRHIPFDEGDGDWGRW